MKLIHLENQNLWLIPSSELVELIVKIASEAYDLEEGSIYLKRNFPNYVRARRAVYVILWWLADYNPRTLGEIFGFEQSAVRYNIETGLKSYDDCRNEEGKIARQIMRELLALKPASFKGSYEEFQELMATKEKEVKKSKPG